MGWTDDDIERALGRLDSTRDLTDDRIDIDRARATLAAAIADASTPPARVTHRIRARAVFASLAAVGIATAVALVVPLFGLYAPSAAADGPPPLPFEPLDASVSEVVERAEAAQQKDPTGVATAMREARSSGWFADIQMNVGDNPLRTIRPENRHLEWSEDLSGELLITAGTAYSSDGKPVHQPEPAPGTIVLQQEFRPGEFSRPDFSEPTTDIDGLRATLNALANGDSTTGAADHLTGVTELLNTWTIPDAVHAAILDVLLEDGDLTVEGTTTDRAGRPAIGLRATSDTTPWLDHIVLLSAETGRIIGVESVYVGLKDELPVPTGTVTNYTLWEATT